MNKNFTHRHAAHCETGTMSNLLRNRGVDLSEPMMFGIGSGLFFVYIPFIKMGGIPLIAYRSAPGNIIKNVCSRLSINMKIMRFRNPERGMAELDRLIEQGTPVGLQTSAYWLPYFPREMRFQFNAHNLVVFGKEKDNYLISDPVGEHTVTCAYDDLSRARFAKGLFAPKGMLYYPDHIPALLDIKEAVKKGIHDTCHKMLKIPLPFLGVRGIHYLANQMERWPVKLGPEKAATYVGTVIRMQEEIGTGGAGFRFMYAAFLQEASDLLKLPALLDIAKLLSDSGDRMREFAVRGVQLCKGRETGQQIYSELAGSIRECAEREKHIFSLLRKAL